MPVRPLTCELTELRLLLIDKIIEAINKPGVTQHDMAQRLQCSQPRVNLILKRRYDQFSLGYLFTYAKRAGLKVDVTITEAS